MFLQWVYLAFFAIFEVGSLVCGVAPSSDVLIIGRAIAGIGVAGIFAGGLTIIASAIRPEKRSGTSCNAFGSFGADDGQSIWDL